MTGSFTGTLRRSLETLLAEQPEISHSWSTSRGFVHLEIEPSGTDGFFVHVNASSDYTLVIADRRVSRKWEGSDRATELRIATIVAFVRDLLHPRTRIREIRRRRRTVRWVLEHRDGGEWLPIASMLSLNPLSYFGSPSESTRSNAWLFDRGAAG